LNKDVPFSPCRSLNGKTTALIVDSDGAAKNAAEEEEEGDQ
jgi:hypothetical protein